MIASALTLCVVLLVLFTGVASAQVPTPTPTPQPCRDALRTADTDGALQTERVTFMRFADDCRLVAVDAAGRERTFLFSRGEAPHVFNGFAGRVPSSPFAVDLQYKLNARGERRIVLVLVDRYQPTVAARRIPARIVVSPASATLVVGGTQQFTVIVSDAAGVAITDAPVTWESYNPRVVTIDAQGRATGIARGTASVFARVVGPSNARPLTSTFRQVRVR